MNIHLIFESLFSTSKKLEKKPQSVNSIFNSIIEVEIKTPVNFSS